ncbi:glycoside hydrolase family 97 protein [Limibacter armeniacum]|uniref:glycoside hydrolase family 97 protein n=1 Tax=Limibacter armeniacum TaxID=466084 RepID=UPI002FE5E324
MKKLRFLLQFVFISFLLFMSQCGTKQSSEVVSPDGKLKVIFSLNEAGKPFYAVQFKDKAILDTSALGFHFKEQHALEENFEIIGVEQMTYDEKWNPVWGEDKTFYNHGNEIKVLLREKMGDERLLNIYFRAYDDGVALRYEIPQQQRISQFEITDELTQFNFTGNPTAWWQPANFDTYELRYAESPLSEVSGANTPITLKAEDSLYLSVHEAALTDYSGMTLKQVKGNLFEADLAPFSPNGDVKVKQQVPMLTPWRVIKLAETAGGLITSHLIENLNEPSKIINTSWIKPGKYIGIWWEMHLKKGTWENKNASDFESLPFGGKPESGQSGIDKSHSANTANAKKYIDFATKHGINGLLIEGWNFGWERGWKGFNFTKAYPDFDIAEVVRYGKEHNVFLIGHHETGGEVGNYEKQLEEAFAFYNQLGIPAVKTGYVSNEGPVDINGEKFHHHGQRMVQHYRKVVETAARYQIMVVAHEPIKPTGIRRTWPNLLAAEGTRGQEYNAWDQEGGNKPWHTTVLPFTRMLAGPVDFTPGIFNIKFDEYSKENRVNTTLAKQLALYVVLYTPMQMAADLPEHYEGNEAFKFIEDVPVNWDETKVLNGEIGNYVTIARRHGSDWYIGAITDENARSVDIGLDFLREGATYEATIYADSPDTDLEHNPAAFDIRKQEVKKGSTLTLKMTQSGGQAISLKMK